MMEDESREDNRRTTDTQANRDLEALLNNLVSDTANHDKWGIDKKIPLTLIGAVIIQTLFFVWGASKLSSQVDNLGKTDLRIEKRIDELTVKMGTMNGQLTNSLIIETVISKEIQNIKLRLARLEDVEHDEHSNKH